MPEENIVYFADSARVPYGEKSREELLVMARQDLDLLPATLPDALRASSSALLTDLTALDYDALGRTLEFLANNSAAVEAQALPGQWNAASGTYTVTDASRAAMQTFFNVSPTEAQASSFSEP